VVTVADAPTAGPGSGARGEILRAAGRPYSWEQVLAGAYFRGAAAALHEEVADALAATSYAREEGFEIPEDAGDAGEAFRVEHSLITGEETEGWLGHCGIPIEEFNAYFASRLLAARFKEERAAIRRDYLPAAGEVVAAMWAAAILSGSFEAFTLPFARRAANLLVSGASADPGELAAARRTGEPRVPETLRAPGLLEELAAMDVLYEAAEREALSAERCAGELREREYQLRRIVVAGAVFPSLDQANEAYQGVVEDGLGLDEVARRAGVEPTEETLFADAAPEGAQPLLSALPGRVLEPEAVEGGYIIRCLRRHIDPELADPVVAARIRERLLASHFGTMLSMHVTWSFDPWIVT
jgi:hypothetical protein